VPRTGGAVIASNHVSYLDFTFVGLGAQPAGRLVRFMAKDAVFRHRVSGPLMRGMKHIAVDRSAGSAAFRDAMAALKSGELVGVFPEATISRSFMLKDFKPGAVRMAAGAGVPIIPAIVWGGQRIFTKGRPKDFRGRGKAITVAFGEPITVRRGGDPQAATDELIATSIHFLPVHQLTWFRDRYPLRAPLPVAERAGHEVLSLPLSPAHSDDDILDAVEALRRVHERFSA